MSAPALTADHVAAAIVAAGREADEDPVAIALGMQPSRGRAYAFHAVRSCFPLPPETAARLVGSSDPRKGAIAMKTARYQAKWWRQDAMDRAVAAIRAVPSPPPATAPIEPSAASPQPARESFPTDVAPRPLPVRRAQDHWTTPPPAKAAARRVVTEGICGDPPPGRSALDRRRAERGEPSPSVVSLPGQRGLPHV